MIANIVIGGIVAVLVILAVRSLFKDRKSGGDCGCGCSGCASAESCDPGKHPN